MFHWFKKHTKDGLERPDPTPLQIALDAKRPLTIHEQIARFVRARDLDEAVKKQGFDTFDEADDFDVDEDAPDFHKALHTPYEESNRPGERILDGVQTRLDEVRAGMVEEIPVDRMERAHDHVRRVRDGGRPKPAPAAPQATAGGGQGAAASDTSNVTPPSN